MVFSGLPVNNPNVEQYQLWIFDTDKGQDHPVDGGVFDIAGTKQVVVPIDARIPVNKAVQFAITVEKPGGVVVSDKSRLPLLAEVVPLESNRPISSGATAKKILGSHFNRFLQPLRFVSWDETVSVKMETDSDWRTPAIEVSFG